MSSRPTSWPTETRRRWPMATASPFSLRVPARLRSEMANGRQVTWQVNKTPKQMRVQARNFSISGAKPAAEIAELGRSELLPATATSSGSPSGAEVALMAAENLGVEDAALVEPDN